MNSPYPERPKASQNIWVILLATCGGCGCLLAIAVGATIYFTARAAKSVIETVAAKSREAQRDLKVVNHKMVTDKGKRFIIGSLKNSSATKSYGSAIVEFYLYDKAGTELDSTSANMENTLKPGGTWKFKAPVTEAKAVSYKFREVSGFEDSADSEKDMTPEQRARMKEFRDKFKAKLEQTIKESKERNGQ